jgi:hypothetical protein
MDADSVDPAELKAILGEASVQLRSRANGSDAQHKLGRRRAGEWLDAHFEQLGVESTVDLQLKYL